MSMTQFQLPNLIQHMREGMMLASMAFVAMEVGPLLASTADSYTGRMLSHLGLSVSL